MSISTFSSAMALIFVGALLWILMDIRFEELSKTQKWAAPLFILLLAVFNQLYEQQVSDAVFGKTIVFTMHIPFFLLFKHISRCSAVKMTFMILSGVVFTSPVVIVSVISKRLFGDDLRMLLFSNIIVYIIMLALAQFVFRKGFNYLIKYGDDRSFLLFSVIPIFYYIYLFAVQNVDVSIYNSFSGYILRYLPTLEVFAFYLLLMNIYKESNEKKELEVSQLTLAQALNLAEQRITLLNTTQAQTAVYRHDMRHHLNAIEAFLSTDKPQQAEEYIRGVQSDLAAISPKNFCQNNLINLLCCSLYEKAKNEGIDLKVDARVPNGISVSDTEICSMISNALENAINAVEPLPEQQRWVEFYCELKRGKLLLEVKNPYSGKIVIKDGLPISGRENHGYGCRSIKAIAENYKGLCSFEAKNNVFTLQVVLPDSSTEKSHK